jgi:hypothetical protein
MALEAAEPCPLQAACACDGLGDGDRAVVVGVRGARGNAAAVVDGNVFYEEQSDE